MTGGFISLVGGMAEAGPFPVDNGLLASHPDVEEHDVRVGHPFLVVILVL
jgi:hypothetical protein